METIKITEVIKFKLYVNARPVPWKEEGELPFSLSVSTYDVSEINNEVITLEIFEKEITVDGKYDLRGAQVDSLNEQKALLVATHTRDIIALDEKINSLLAIEHTPAEVE